MIACLILISAKLIAKNELEVSTFLFLAAMMLAYQPVRSLATLNITIQQGLAGAKRVLPVIDGVQQIRDHENSVELKISNADINLKKFTQLWCKERDQPTLKI